MREDISTLLRDTTPRSVRDLDLHELHRRGRRRRHLARAGGVAASVASVAAVLIAVTTVVGGNGNGPRLEPVSGGPAAAPPDAWTQVTLDVDFGEACTQVGQRDCARLSDVVRSGEVFVVAGTDGSDPLVLSSKYGRDWDVTRLPVPEGAVGGWVNALAVGGDGRVVAVGGVDHGPSSGEAPAYARAAWFSADGRSWELVPAGPVEGMAYEVTDVARYGGGFVATALEGGGSLATDLRLLTSEDGTRWDHGPILGGRLPALEQSPVVGVTATPEVTVYAAIGGACEPGLAVWRSMGKDDLPAGYANSDDPTRADPAQPTPGLENVVPVPCPNVEQTDTDGATTATWQLHAAPAVHIGPSPDGPRLRTYLPDDENGFVQHDFTVTDDGWQDIGAVADGERVDLITAAPTDGYRMAWGAIDTPWTTDAGDTNHAVGDGVGRGLEIWTNEDGVTWRRAEGRDTPGEGDRAGSNDLSRVQLHAGTGCTEPDTPAIAANASVLAQDRGITVGFVANCLTSDQLHPALWLGPLP